MKTYEFNVVLKDTTEVTDDQADALFAAGCEDGTPASSNGTACVHFDRGKFKGVWSPDPFEFSRIAARPRSVLIPFSRILLFAHQMLFDLCLNLNLGT